MDVQYREFPQPHAIIDNFLPQELYDRIKSAMNDLDGGLHQLPEENEVRNAFGNMLTNIRNKLLEQVPNASEQEMTPNDYVIWVNKQQPHTSYKIHIDSLWKRLSTIVYVGEINQGTRFHESMKEDSKIVGRVEWKENRAMAFVPSSTSFHSYANDKDYFRDTILINMGSIESVAEEIRSYKARKDK
jgi:hypothetical protein